MNQKDTKQRKRKRSRRSNTEQKDGTSFNERGLTRGDATIVHLQKWRIQPPRVLVWLRYTYGAVATAVGGATTSKTWRCNGLWDVDPILGSAPIPGFTEWSTLYGLNRVISIKATFDVSNFEAFPVRISSGYFPYVIVAGAYGSNNYGNRYCRDFMLGSNSGQSRRRWVHSMNMAELFGNPAVVGDLNQFYGTGGSNPGTLGSVCLGIHSPTGSVFTSAGVAYALDFDFLVEFSGASTLTQLMPPEERKKSQETPSTLLRYQGGR